ncbi:MAG TPA: phenylalanine--tRNA ligase beta subunit-related protein, partial [Solirubrobacteraceae bacterium]|nr:phenylalanine--tRNA ligase beta subunit-related protein [Solirubrobacteraceae bacterium]
VDGVPAARALRLEVDPAIFERFPGYRAGVVVAEGVTNGPSDDASRATLAAAEARASLDHAHLSAWRDAFRAFGAKRYRCSAEALISRALSGDLPRISALVDHYNAVSIAHSVPVGGEDLDHVVPPVRLVLAAGGEAFDDDAAVKVGEVVWTDAVGVTCRRWNWRQGVRTRLTESTTRAYFLFDALPPFSDAQLAAAMDDLRGSLLAAWPGAELSSWVVSGPTAAG